MAGEGEWSQLVCTTDPLAEIVTISKNKFTIGRAKLCDLILEDNRMVSSNHCYIERDTEGRVWIEDTSTNGTLINMTDKLGSGKRMMLNHGDEIYVVYRKKDISLNVAYLFQDLAELAKEELEETGEDLDATQEYSSDAEPTIQESAESSPSRKRTTQEPESQEGSSSKKIRMEDTTVATFIGQLSESSNKHDIPQNAGKETANESAEMKTDNESAFKEKGNSKVEMKAEEEEKKSVTEEKTDGQKEAAAGEKTDGQKEAATAADTDETDDFAETLMCIICQEIMHDCISLQPCMHAFCAGCYSDWMKQSNECPSCRMKVERINKNHIVNNLIEAYLKNHPDKKRPEEDIKELDAKNKITRDMLYPKSRRSSDESDEESISSDSDDDGNVTGSSLGSTPVIPGVAGGQLGPAMAGNLPIFTSLGTGTIFHAGHPMRPPRTVCRQCPNYVDTGVAGVGSAVGRVVAAAGNVVNRMLGIFSDPVSSNVGDTASSAPPAVGTSTGAGGTGSDAGSDAAPVPGTSTAAGVTAERLSEGVGSDVKVMPTPPAYTCTPGQTHILCVCCLQPMPDRRHQVTVNAGVQPMQCSVCYRSFCHLYWGCRKADCLGCLSRFTDMNFGTRSLDNIILENPHESQILKDHLDNKGLNVKTLLAECLQKFDSGQYTCTDKARFNIASNSVVCYACGLRNYRDLAYQYRRDIPRDQLPVGVTGRPDCYWGKNCRTQKNKPLHAIRFNHICEQTRTS